MITCKKKRIVDNKHRTRIASFESQVYFRTATLRTSQRESSPQ